MRPTRVTLIITVTLRIAHSSQKWWIIQVQHFWTCLRCLHPDLQNGEKVSRLKPTCLTLRQTCRPQEATYPNDTVEAKTTLTAYLLYKGKGIHVMEVKLNTKRWPSGTIAGSLSVVNDVIQSTNRSRKRLTRVTEKEVHCSKWAVFTRFGCGYQPGKKGVIIEVCHNKKSCINCPMGKSTIPAWADKPCGQNCRTIIIISHIRPSLFSLPCRNWWPISRGDTGGSSYSFFLPPLHPVPRSLPLSPSSLL